VGDCAVVEPLNFSCLGPTVLACRFRAFNESEDFSLETVDRPPERHLGERRPQHLFGHPEEELQRFL